MKPKYCKDNFGEPSIEIVGLQIWIHGKQFADSEDYWDGNWLNVTAHCGAENAEVWVSGSILHLSELKSWLEDLESVNANLSGEASLDCMEPELNVEMKIQPLGHILMKVEITPDNLTQFHSFEFETDQSYLPVLIKNLKKVLEKYPVKGNS
jgi:hypothetical protein